MVNCFVNFNEKYEEFTNGGFTRNELNKLSMYIQSDILTSFMSWDEDKKYEISFSISKHLATFNDLF